MTGTASPLYLFASLLGGIGLFLLGMTMLTDGLKMAAGRTLERILAAWTRTPVHGLFTGILVTALVQSSTAMTVASIGFVNAGLLSFTSALWVVFGSNVGTTITGWLVAMVGFKIKIDAFALPFIGVGVALKLTGQGTRRGGFGDILAGFGVLFLGIDLLKDGFASLGPDALPQLGSGLTAVVMAVLIGIVVTIVLQASSATLTLVLTAVAGGMLPVEAGAGMVIGANIGTTLTGIVAAISATSNARRLAAAHVVFNVVTAVVALALLSPLLALIQALGVRVTGNGDAVTQLVIFHSVFNILGVLLMWPLSTPLVHFLLARFRTPDEDESRPHYLDLNVAEVPSLALQALRRELARMGHLATKLACEAVQLNPVNASARSLPSPQSEVRLARQLATVEQLQKQIGSFVSQISSRPMHPDVADQLPELLRIATHFDTLARVTYHIGVQGAHDVHKVAHQAGVQAEGAEADLHVIVAPVFAAALAFLQAADPEAGSPVAGNILLVDEAHDAFEETYQATKACLLHAGAGGKADVVEVYEWLARLSDLRRAVEQDNKAAHRLAALTDLVATPTPGAAEQPVPAASGAKGTGSVAPTAQAEAAPSTL